MPTLSMADESSSTQIIAPQYKSKKADVHKIEAGNFELGTSIGWLSVEDFNTNSQLGLQIQYHFSERFLGSLRYSTSDTKKSPLEIGDLNFIPDRTFSSKELGFGYALFSGKNTLGAKHRLSANIYATVGLASIDFAAKSNTGFFYGATYKTIINQHFSVDFHFKNLIVKRDILDDDKSTMNTEMSIGINKVF